MVQNLKRQTLIRKLKKIQDLFKFIGKILIFTAKRTK